MSKENAKQTEEMDTQDKPENEVSTTTQENKPTAYEGREVSTDVQSVFGGNSVQVVSSFGTDLTPAEKIKVYNAMNDNDGNISDMLGEVIDVQHMVAFPIEMSDDETGELIKTVRVVLVTPAGKSYGSVAGGVVSSLQKIIGVVGQAPWLPAIKVVPVEKKTRKGFKTIVLRMHA